MCCNPYGVDITTCLGDRPAVLAFQIRQQSQHQTRSMPGRLVASEPGPDPIHQRAKLIEPVIGILGSMLNAAVSAAFLIVFTTNDNRGRVCCTIR
jgi:hypothetical protein